MKKIMVFADWKNLPKISQVGVLRAEVAKGEEIFSFEYSKDWLDSGHAQEIDPDLKLYHGPQYLAEYKSNFGLFLDSAPDRWGRTLMKRRESIRARELNEKPKVLLESDFLLGVNDETRMGALRFKLNADGNFLETDEVEKVPPITSIRELEQISLKLEEDDFLNHDNAKKWLAKILAPGSSLGGARPKASVRHPDGSLWIAKFPSKNDEKNSGIWEFLVNQMGHDLGIKVAIGDAAIYSQRQHTYLTKRFDRSIENKRIHFASALTLLGYKDGYNHKDGGNYLELVELIERYGASPKSDIRELWKRIVFSVAISNTDDHLRNHGFLLSDKGWLLSPAFDINSNERGIGLSLNISEDDNSLDYELCLSVADYFRWTQKEANSFLQKTKNIVSTWPKRADNLKISRSEKNLMEPAFNF